MMDSSSEENLENASDNSSMAEVSIPEKNVHEKMCKELEHFINSETFSDIDVKVDDEVFKCHKIILASTSSYFNALFMSGMKEMKHGIVELTAIEKDDFQDILKFMYTGHCNIDKGNIQGLFYSASYLQILPLIDSCENFIKKTLCKADEILILHYLQITCRQLNLINLAEHIINYIARKFKKYEDSNKLLESLSFDDMKALLGAEKLCWNSEDEICTTMLSWIDVDCSGRQRYARDLVKKIRYLALSNDYMRNIFLEHKAIKENEDCDEIRSDCFEYLSAPLLQSDYIGDLAASHRIGHNCTSDLTASQSSGQQLTDVIAVFYQNCVKFLTRLEEDEDSLGFIHFVDMNLIENNIKRPKDLNEEGITACNYGRSEIMLSNGIRLLHFNGLTWVWTSGPKHRVQSNRNCIVCNERTGDIFNIVVDTVTVFIEKCKFDHDKGFGEWEIEMQKDIENSSYDQERTLNDRTETTFQEKDRTCAYMVGKNIFFIKTGVAPEPDRAAVFKYNTETKAICIVNTLPSKYVCATVVTHKGFVFLIDGKGQSVLRISEDGHCFEKYGKIGLDFQDEDEQFSKFSGACIFKGKLIRVKDMNNEGDDVGTTCLVSYDLCQHVTKVLHLHSLFACRNVRKNAVCLKLTLLPK